MKSFFTTLILLSSLSALADEAICREAIEQVSITSSLLREYELKESISPEMEENRVRIVGVLKSRLPVEMDAAVSVCREK
ncbi:MAG: hypothetical protein HYW49_08500 [Deltaproteobacteria bacterium]|nr:hypothetical protein [Deltaproteobacteria bacterium]